MTSDTLSGLYNDSYYWRIRAVDNLGNIGEYSETRGFVVDTDVDQVALSFPATGYETSLHTFRLEWTALADSVGVDSYQIEVNNTIGFTAAMAFSDTIDGANTTDTLAGLYNDSYYWRVRAVDELGNNGVFGTMSGFVVDTSVLKVTLTKGLSFLIFSRLREGEF